MVVVYVINSVINCEMYTFGCKDTIIFRKHQIMDYKKALLFITPDFVAHFLLKM